MAITQRQVQRFLLIGGSIFALSMAYGSGMRAQVPKIKKYYESYKIYRQEARLAQLTLRAKEAQIQQLEARRLLDVAQNDFERGDIGAAKVTILEALTRLRIAQSAEAATTADMTAMIADLEKLSLNDPVSAKLALHNFAIAMDEKLTQASVAPTPDALSSVTIPPPNDNEKPTLPNEVTQTR